MKIALVVYACDPYGGSEGGVGWNMLINLSESYHVYAYVEKEKFKESILKYKQNNPSELKNVYFNFISRRRYNFIRKLWPPSYFYFYRKWQNKTYDLIKEQNNFISFDLIHVCTLVGYRAPGPFYKLNIPLVWGPIGGLGYFNLKFSKYISNKGILYYLVYNTINWLTLNFSSKVKKAIIKSQLNSNGLICADYINQKIIHNKFGVKSNIFSEITPPKISARHSPLKETKFIELSWIGIMEDRKGMLLALKIFELLDNSKYKLNVFGEGNKLIKYKNIAAKKNLNVKFHGNKEREYTLKYLKASKLLLFTSFRDLTATVTVEANSLGVPVICLNHCGFGYWLEKKYNIFIDVSSKNILQDFVNEINLFEPLSKKNKEELKIKTFQIFSWSNKLDILNKIYIGKTTT